MKLEQISLVALMFLLTACERAQHNMYDQPRYKPYGASELFENNMASRSPPPNAVPYASGDLAGPSSARMGPEATIADDTARSAQSMPYPVTTVLLAKGRERYEIYCQPCHSPVGDGDGRVVRRGFPAPPSYHNDRLRNTPDRHLFDVMTNGYGVMFPYADRLTPEERWTVVAYIRALQLSQYADVDSLPAALRGKLPAPATAGVQP